MFLILTTLWSLGFITFWLNIQKTYPLPQNNPNAIIVLTGGKNRIKTGLSLLSKNLSKKLFITGVHPDTKLQDIKTIWANKNLPCCITLGHEATTTIQNTQEVKKWLAPYKYKNLLLVTSDYHMPRALLEFKHAMPDVIFIPHSVQSVKEDTKRIKLLISEYHKTIFRWLQIKLSAKTTS